MALAAKLNHLRVAVLRSHGDAPLDLREHVEAHAAHAAGRALDAPAIVPPALRPFLEKVARHAYEVTGADIEHLRHEGYGDDAIFEILVCAAVGAGSARFERARELLHDAPAEG